MFQNKPKIFILNLQEISKKHKDRKGDKEKQNKGRDEEFTKTKMKFNLKVNIGKYLHGDNFAEQLIFTRLSCIQKNYYGKR